MVLLRGGEVKSTPSPRPKTGVWQKQRRSIELSEDYPVTLEDF